LVKTGASTPLQAWYQDNPDDIPEFEKQMRRKVHYVIRPPHLWNSIANMARTQSDELLMTLQGGFKYIETESFQSAFLGLFSEINLYSEKLGRTQTDKNKKLCSIIAEIAKGLAEFSADVDALGDAYEYLIGQFAAGSGKKAGEFYTPQQISDILSALVTLDSQEPKTGKKDLLTSVLDFACGSGSLLLNVRKRMGPHGIGKIYGQEKNITTYNLARMNMLLHGVKDTEFEIYHGDTLTNDWDILRELNPAKKPAFDAIVANPPFSYRWEPTDAMGDDVRALQELWTGAQIRRRFRLPAARLSLPERRRRDGHHPAPRSALSRRRRRTHPHQAAEGRPYRYRHRPTRQPVLLHRHPRLHPCTEEVQEAR
jgi:type I restriction enzyme M protein